VGAGRVVVAPVVVVVVGAVVAVGEADEVASAASGSRRVHATTNNSARHSPTRRTAADVRPRRPFEWRAAGTLAAFPRSTHRRNGGRVLSEAHYPATEGEQPVTKDYLDARLAELRVELHRGFNRVLIGIPASTAAICAAVAFVARLGT
jgi:hypothetical protein